MWVCGWGGRLSPACRAASQACKALQASTDATAQQQEACAEAPPAVQGTAGSKVRRGAKEGKKQGRAGCRMRQAAGRRWRHPSGYQSIVILIDSNTN